MTQEQKARAYDKALERASKLSKLTVQNPFDTVSQMMEEVFPELAENEDERIRKALIEYFNEQCDMSDWNGVYGYQVVAWLEKQGNKTEEYIFRPIVGCSIDDAARQAIDKVTNGENIVFSFNGFYMKIYNDTNTDNIINSYYDFCKKQGIPKWTEEDEPPLEEVCGSIKYAEKHRKTCSEKLTKLQLDWLKSLKQRMEE